jgi:beta-phosphoglucomutase-like phosphatase (HAD superfamily)
MKENKLRYFTNNFLNKTLKKSSLVILDMNGLIVDDEELQFKSVNKTLEKLNIEITEEYWIECCVGKRADEYFRTILELRGITAYVSIDELVEKKNTTYRGLIQSCVKKLTRPGVIEFVEYVRLHPRLKLVLSTSALPDEVDTILGAEGLRILHRFSYIATGQDVKKSKPDPEIYRFLSRKTGIPPDRCLVFEDSNTGVSAASNTGMNSIAVPNRYTAGQDFSKALCVIDSLRKNAVFL